jgi:hypothetical protein
MSVNEVKTPLSEVLLSLDGKGINKKYIDIILEEEIPVLCINSGTQKKRLMLFKTLYDTNENFWMNKSGTWDYYLTKDDFDKLKEKAVSKPGIWDKEIQKPAADKETQKPAADKEIQKPAAAAELEELPAVTEAEVKKGFGDEYKTFLDMSEKERVDHLNKDKNRLDELLLQKNVEESVVTHALIDTTKSAALINHAVLEDAINHADDEAKKLTQGIVDSTNEMVKSSSKLIAENILNNELINAMVEKSNGTVIQHMTRVYLNGIAFLSYYNTLVSTSSAIQRLRIKFASEYREYYHSLLPHVDIDDIDLERVFYGGMRAVKPDVLLKWAIGFLIHDIGKAAAVEYHEGEASYDRKIVVDHVKQGFRSIMNKTNYPTEVSLITGYHHEYYGDPDGYGYFRAYLAKYKKDNPAAKQDYCITYELEPILDYTALAYFPAKVLEIIDVFDSLTDPHRVYRKSMNVKEALELMREEFIVKHHKIDLILFDIFSTFMTEKKKSK